LESCLNMSRTIHMQHISFLQLQNTFPRLPKTGLPATVPRQMQQGASARYPHTGAALNIPVYVFLVSVQLDALVGKIVNKAESFASIFKFRLERHKRNAGPSSQVPGRTRANHNLRQARPTRTPPRRARAHKRPLQDPPASY